MDQCTVTNNVALLSGGGIFTTGGGTWGTGGTVVISNSTLADNNADRGGGIFVEGSGISGARDHEQHRDRKQRNCG